MICGLFRPHPRRDTPHRLRFRFAYYHTKVICSWYTNAAKPNGKCLSDVMATARLSDGGFSLLVAHRVTQCTTMMLKVSAYLSRCKKGIFDPFIKTTIQIFFKFEPFFKKFTESSKKILYPLHIGNIVFVVKKSTIFKIFF